MSSLTHACDDLIFRVDGKLYDASTLRRYDTRDPAQPAIYVTPDGSTAFLATVDAIGTLGIKLVNAIAVQKLATKYRIKDLLHPTELHN